MNNYPTVRLTKDTENHKAGQAGFLIDDARESYLVRFADGDEEWLSQYAFEFVEEE